MSNDQKRSVWTGIVAILAILIIELYALSKGINGKCMTATVAAIAGVGGFSLRGFLPSGK